ncbi:MAG: carboxypeptidase regulatory-like domain-containing protein [Candidatus Acidiferrales bacterium]
MRSVSTTLALSAFLVATALSAATASRDQQNKHAHDFLIYVTVFTDQGFSLPGANVRVRRASEKKWRWDSISDARGEFAIRVPEGDQYEMIIQAKGFQPMTREIDAREGNRDDLRVQMVPLPRGKPK